MERTSISSLSKARSCAASGSELGRGGRDEQEAIKKLEKNKEIGEDDARRRLEALQKATDAKTAEIDRMAASKEREVLEG